MQALEKHTTSEWVKLYVKRWLVVPYQTQSGQLLERKQGVPQGSVIGPLLANLFLHYAFDAWMKQTYPHLPFERYADDCICHCRSKQEAQSLLLTIQQRLKRWELEVNETKTKLVYCKDSNRVEQQSQHQFDFLGYSFRPRRAVNQRGQYFVSFLPAISTKAKKKIGDAMRQWWSTSRTDLDLKEIAEKYNAKLEGWINYYGKFYKSELVTLFGRLNQRLTIWVTKKYKRYRGHRSRAKEWLARVAKQAPNLFAHWKHGFVPPLTMSSLETRN